MRISDWSSDVCSSDLAGAVGVDGVAGVGVVVVVRRGAPVVQRGGLVDAVLRPIRIRMRYDGGTVGFAGIHVQGKRVPAAKDVEIGRASCRERVCPYV